MPDPPFLGLSPTQWIAVITVALAVIATVQAFIYAAIHRTTKAIERAWVSLEALEIEGDRDRRVIAAGFRNSGHTTAKIVAINISVRSSQQDANGTISDLADLSDAPTYDDAQFAPPAILVADDTSRMRVDVNQFDQMNAWRLRVSSPGDDVAFWIYGYIHYTDSLSPKIVRKYGWARRYDPWLSRSKQPPRFRFAHVNKPGYNYAD